jgi:hypothetical protein
MMTKDLECDKSSLVANVVCSPAKQNCGCGGGSVLWTGETGQLNGLDHR